MVRVLGLTGGVALACLSSGVLGTLPQAEKDIAGIKGDLAEIEHDLEPLVAATHHQRLHSEADAAARGALLSVRSDDPDEECNGIHHRPRPKADHLALTLAECRAAPLAFHFARAGDVELCFADGTDGARGVPSFRSPTASSACEFAVVARWHDRSDGLDTEAMLVESKFDNRVMVYIRGSDGHYGDWIRTNFKVLQRRVTVAGVKVGRVHKGFEVAWRSLERHGGIYAKIRAYVAAGKRIVFAGHSLGGGVAAVGALYTRLTVPESTIDYISSGSPRVGNRRFAALFAEQVRTSKRYVATFTCKGKTYSDMVTTIPPRSAFQASDARASAAAIKAAHAAKLSAEDLADLDAAVAESSDLDDNGDTLGEEPSREEKGLGRAILSAPGWLLRKITGTVTATAQRGVIAALATLTSYRHVDGLDLVDSGIRLERCDNHVSALKNSFRAHATYRDVFLEKQLPEYMASERA
eukprot:TRINITY_DN246_c0_g2_i1.p1 TRINITY_DN246_c0_g2~~TRINITY_DN246_c0_g2_i1.p1  ORF type:complete len:478 (+),score=190.02 TRINITY_DN246_c0_g2_i1:32-1435(+)